LFAVEEDIAAIALNRPKVGNRINRELADGLVKTLARAADDASVKAVVLKGNGKFFCTGGDIPPGESEGRRDRL
jgi:2-(1,2-epoxy-1,2-dihydrophenyl)acetyl-CoA isomerase